MIVFDLVLATRRRQLTGIERFGINLFRAMRERAPDTIAFVSDAAAVRGPDVIAVASPLRGWLGLPWRAGRGTTIVAPSYPASPLFALSRHRVVRIVHDDFPWTRGEGMPWRGRLLFRDLDAAMMRRYDEVAAPAGNVAAALSTRFRRPVAAVGNAPGIAVEDITPTPVAALEGRRFVILVGTVEPRKNYDALVALAASPGAADLVFVVAGRAGWGEVVERLRSAANGRLVWLDGADDAELAWLYRNAAAFLTLSHAEGFNMPLVEAAIAGCPIVCSDLPIHREVAPADAVLVPAGAAPEAIAHALREAVAGGRREREAYRVRFSWDAIARNVATLAEG
jgi:glycosyltransferase involved in cell wall biosynthesis